MFGAVFGDRQAEFGLKQRLTVPAGISILPTNTLQKLITRFSSYEMSTLPQKNGFSGYKNIQPDMY